MAILIEERLVTQDDDEDQTEFSEVGSDESQVTELTHTEDNENEGIPDKYKGKTVQQIVQMHQEAEKLLGRQSSEVGDLRKVVDQYIQTQLVPQQNNNYQSSVNQEQEEETDFFSDPETAVRRAIDNHPDIRKAKEDNVRSYKSNALAQLQSKHPEMSNILGDPAFGEWVQSSKIRTKLFIEADQKFDYDSADELFSNWKERGNMVNQTVAAEKQNRKQAVKSASTGTATGSSEASSRKIYRRADIIKLMKTDPDRYQMLSDEILQAYSEGRVKS